MEIWNWQLLTVVPLGCMCLYLYFIVGNLMRKSHSVGEIAWIAELEKEGKRKILELPEGSFLLGNGFMNDIRIRAGDETIRLYINVQKKEVAISVLKGKILVGNYTYRSDARERIVLSDGKSIQIGNVNIRFVKKVM